VKPFIGDSSLPGLRWFTSLDDAMVELLGDVAALGDWPPPRVHQGGLSLELPVEVEAAAGALRTARPRLLLFHSRFGIDEVPTLIVVEDRQVRGRIVDSGCCKAIERFLAPWLH
jgi:hypothetical protein